MSARRVGRRHFLARSSSPQWGVERSRVCRVAKGVGRRALSNTMDAAFDCTICGSPKARLCSTCRSAAYWSVGCPQTDCLIHRQLCKKFGDAIKRRPSPSHCLTIHLPMKTEEPSLEWVNTRKVKHETIATSTPTWTASSTSPALRVISVVACFRSVEMSCAGGKRIRT